MTILDWAIIVPKESTNLVKNPSIENNTTGYTAENSTLLRTSEDSRWGAYSLKVTPVGDNDGVYYTDTTVVLASGTTYTVSWYMHGAVAKHYEAFISDNAGINPLNNYDFDAVEGWSRYSFQYTEITASAQRRIYIRTDNNGGDATPFYIDGLNIIATTDEETYIDGDQPGCFWNGGEHSSTSTRDDQYRRAGKIVNLGDYGIRGITPSNTGMTTPDHTVLNYGGLVDGALYQGTRQRPRVFQLAAQLTASGQANLHVLRAALEDAVKINLVGQQQEMLIRYTGASSSRDISVVYEGGLEFNATQPFVETVPLRFVANDPFWYDTANASEALTSAVTTSGSYITQRNRFGEWDHLDSTFNGSVYAIAFDKTIGKYIIGGNFTTPVAYLAEYDPVDGSFANVGGIAPNSSSNAILIDDTTGDLYIGGAFTAVGVVANTRGIARYTRSTNTWSAVGAGLNNGVVLTLAMGYDRTLYIGGTFTAMSGVANTNRIAKYNPDTNVVTALGLGMNGDVYDITIGPDAYPYVTGDFTTSDGETTRGLARWNGATFDAIGSLTGNIPGRVVQFGLDGVLYWSFNSTTLNGVLVNYIAKWNGTQWSSLGTGITAIARAMVVDKTGNILVGGEFFTAGDITLPSPIAIWNGTQWYPVGYNVPSLGSAIRDIHLNLANGDLTLGWTVAAGTITEAMEIVTNDGSADAYPLIHIIGSTSATAKLYFIKNYTTGDVVYFNTDLTLNPNERITLDLTNKTIVSNFQGKLDGKIIPGSNIGQLRLIAGDNKISVFTSRTDVTVNTVWKNRYISFDR